METATRCPTWTSSRYGPNLAHENFHQFLGDRRTAERHDICVQIGAVVDQAGPVQLISVS